MAPLRWGIASCGKISADFVNAFQHLEGNKHVAVACAARSKSSAEQFASKFGIQKSYGSYQELANDADVDVVYIGSINTTHYAISKIMIDAGKPILCEKPLCMNLRETQQLIAEAKKRNIFFMEAMWSRCNPVYKELKERVRRGDIGKVTHAHVDFGFKLMGLDRVTEKDLGAGCVLDLGIYVVQYILCVMGDEKPLDVKATGKLNDQGVEMEIAGYMKFSDDRFATFNISNSVELPNEATVTGTNGTLRLGFPFYSPTDLYGPPKDFSAPLDPSTRIYNFPNSQNLKYEAEEVAMCLQKGLKESPMVPHQLTLLFADVIQQIRESAGVKV